MCVRTNVYACMHACVYVHERGTLTGSRLTNVDKQVRGADTSKNFNHFSTSASDCSGVFEKSG